MYVSACRDARFTAGQESGVDVSTFARLELEADLEELDAAARKEGEGSSQAHHKDLAGLLATSQQVMEHFSL